MSTDTTKRYSLVKWLDNSQCDISSEWLGRITSVLHTNIIDCENIDNLKSGSEISIFRNGELWKGQVIIPKTNMGNIDLPPTNHKIRTAALPVKDNEATNIETQDFQQLSTTHFSISTFENINDSDKIMQNELNKLQYDLKLGEICITQNQSEINKQINTLNSNLSHYQKKIQKFLKLKKINPTKKHVEVLKCAKSTLNVINDSIKQFCKNENGTENQIMTVNRKTFNKFNDFKKTCH